MPKSTIDDILERLKALQTELETELDKLLTQKRELFRYTLDKGKVKFDYGIKVLQRQKRTGLFRYIFGAHIGHLLTAPIIYSVVFPVLLLDIMATLYQQICFRIYGIPIVSRRQYIIIDRQHLAYLNIIEKLNCVYCGYSNGLIEYVREIAQRTEQYWCPIKHAQRTPDPHPLTSQFFDYGDAEAYKMRHKEIREAIRNLQQED